jgi:23S rRNA pseudouridine2605 synthase
MRKPTGGKRPDTAKPAKPPGRPGRPGVYSQRLIRESMKGAQPRPPARADDERTPAPRGTRSARKPDGQRPDARGEKAIHRGRSSGSTGEDSPRSTKPVDTTLTKFRTRKAGFGSATGRIDRNEGKPRRAERDSPHDATPPAPRSRVERADRPDQTTRPRKGGRLPPLPPRTKDDTTSRPPNRPAREGYSTPARPTARTDPSARGPAEPMRIAKAMARAGLCSRHRLGAATASAGSPRAACQSTVAC